MSPGVRCVDNSNDTVLEQFTDSGEGSYAYVDSLDETVKLLVEDLTSNLQVTALDAKV